MLEPLVWMEQRDSGQLRHQASHIRMPTLSVMLSSLASVGVSGMCLVSHHCQCPHPGSPLQLCGDGLSQAGARSSFISCLALTPHHGISIGVGQERDGGGVVFTHSAPWDLASAVTRQNKVMFAEPLPKCKV